MKFKKSCAVFSDEIFTSLLVVVYEYNYLCIEGRFVCLKPIFVAQFRSKLAPINTCRSANVSVGTVTRIVTFTQLTISC